MSKRLSAYYIGMAKNVFKLRITLLPPINANGTYSEEEQIRIKTFRVMAHAELESYFENRCREILTATKDNQNPIKNARIKDSLKNFCARKEGKYATTKSDKEIFSDYNSRIKDNHGIKENNVFSLFSPLGIPIEKIDPTLVATLDSYGSKRGFLAHNAITQVPNDPVIRVVLDPSIETNEINKIIKQIKKIDKIFDNYMN